MIGRMARRSRSNRLSGTQAEVGLGHFEGRGWRGARCGVRRRSRSDGGALEMGARPLEPLTAHLTVGVAREQLLIVRSDRMSPWRMNQ